MFRCPVLANAAASQNYVRLVNPVYSYLDRLATQGLLPEYLNGTKPLQRGEIASQLQILEQKISQLSETDRELLREYLAEFRFEVGDKRYFKLSRGQNSYFLGHSWETLRDGASYLFSYHRNQELLHIYVHENESEMLWIDWDEMARYETKNSLGRLVWQDGFRITSQLGRHFSFYVDGYRFIQTERAGFNEPTREYRGGYFKKAQSTTSPHSNSFDYSHAYMQFHSIAGDFRLAIQPLYWGNSPNSMILSNNTQAFAYLGWQRYFGKSKYSFFHGSLLPKNAQVDPVTGQRSYAQKYLVGQRFEFIPHNRLHLAFTEAVVYGNRNPDLVYMIPVVFLWPTQHNLMDRDNVLMAGEFEYFPVNRVKMYGTVLIDELSPSEIFKKYWGNKHGLQLGVQYTPPLKKYATDITLEFTAVRPWTYTHKSSIDTYTHNGVGLGFYADPNSQLWYARNRWWFGRRNRLTIAYRQLKHGMARLNPGDPNYAPVGNDPNQNYENRDASLDHDTPALLGTIATSQELSLLWNYRLSDLLSLEGGYALSVSDTATDHYFSLQVRFDY